MAADRTDFLLRLYDQMFNDIDRQITVVWQAVTVLAGSFAVLSLVEKHIVTPDVAAGVVVILATWVIAHAEEGSYWYFRNLVIIANIERSFLTKADLSAIHPYFGTHAQYHLLTQLKIQVLLGVAIGLLGLGVHFVTEVVPGFWLKKWTFEWQMCVPYVAATAGVVMIHRLRAEHKRKYNEFSRSAPGPELS